MPITLENGVSSYSFHSGGLTPISIFTIVTPIIYQPSLNWVIPTSRATWQELYVNWHCLSEFFNKGKELAFYKKWICSISMCNATVLFVCLCLFVHLWGWSRVYLRHFREFPIFLLMFVYNETVLHVAKHIECAVFVCRYQGVKLYY